MNNATIGKPLAVGIAVIVTSGCIGTVKRPEPDKWDCRPPASAVFKKVGVDLNFAQSTFGDIVVGTIDVKAKPDVVNLASQAATDAEIIEYIRCLAIKRDGYNPEQATYLQEMISFVATKPTAAEFIEWKHQNKFPGTPQTVEPSVAITIPSGWTFREAAEAVAQLGKSNVRFNGFEESELLMGLKETSLKAKTHQKLLEALGGSSIGKFPNYKVIYEEPTYEIKAIR